MILLKVFVLEDYTYKNYMNNGRHIMLVICYYGWCTQSSKKLPSEIMYATNAFLF